MLVAPQFAQALDVDDDGSLSPAEIDAHVAAVQAVVTAEVDGRTVDLAPAEHRYAPLDLLAVAAGTISITWVADLPADARTVVLTDRYEPGGRVAVQMSVREAADPSRSARSAGPRTAAA